MTNVNRSISLSRSIAIGLATQQFVSSAKASDAVSYELEFQTKDIFKYAPDLLAKRDTKIDETARPNALLDVVPKCDRCDTGKDRIAFTGGQQ